MNLKQCLIFCFLFVLLCFSCGNKQTKNIIFDGEYPPLKIVTYTENGKSYEIEAVAGHCLLFFTDNISQSQAQAIIAQHSGKIIEQMPAFNYYLAQVSEGKENDFISQIRENENVVYAFLNTPQSIMSAAIFDDFKEYQKSMPTTHGQGVSKIFNDYSSRLQNVEKIDVYNSDIDVVFYNRVCANLFKFVSNTKTDEIAFVNMSFGPAIWHKTKINDKDTIVRAKYYDANVAKSERDDYEKWYKETLEGFATCFKKIENEGYNNFLITKSSGNEGMWFMDSILNRINPETADILQNHLILVNAFDESNRLYSNHATSKQALMTTIDISDDLWDGTSFAAPKLLGFIDRAIFKYPILNAQDMLQAVRNATPNNPRQAMTYETLEREAKKIADSKREKGFTFVLDMTSEYSGEWNLSNSGKSKNIVKYTVHNTCDSEYISGKKMAIDIQNLSGYNLEIVLNCLESDYPNYIYTGRDVLVKNQKNSYYAYDIGTYKPISVKTLEIKIIIQ